MTTGVDKGRETFRLEAVEILDQLEIALLALEKTPGDPTLIDPIFRGMHTLKGSGAMFGFDRIAAFVHDLETVYDRVRDGRLQATPELIDLTLRACDHIRTLLDHAGNALPEPITDAGKIIHDELQKLHPSAGKSNGQGKVQSAPQTQPRNGLPGDHVYWIHFAPHPHLFKTGNNPALLFKELQALGTCAWIANTDAIPDLEDLDPDLCLTSWNLILRTSREENAVWDVFIFVEGDCDLTIRRVDADPAVTPKAVYDYLAKKLNTRQLSTCENLEDALRALSGPAPATGSDGDESPRTTREEMQARSVASIKRESIRVASDKLDTLINLVGEMVIVQAGLKRKADVRQDPELASLSEQIERLTWDLRDASMSMRLLPIGLLFNRFQRLVRDLTKEEDKQAQLVIHGEETELDKSLIEQLNDPIMHLIRNCIDHGLESPAVRKKAGKPEQGRIMLSARQSGFDVLITVEDDGAGLDAASIRTRAIEKGLINPKTDLKENDLYALIFTPGFSTKSAVSNISGRGVGMDVVRSNIEALGGDVSVSSRQSAGTKITLRVPLTLGIIEGLLVSIGHESYVFPLSAVEECVELAHQNGRRRQGRQLLNIRDQAVPYIRLREHFNIKNDPPEIEEVLITGNAGQPVGFVVDHIIGNQQIVIKPLGHMYRDVEGLSGATILGDGTVGLILDIARLSESALLEGAVV